ncbi:hypothetical protein [Granulicella sp. dw_53]|uniref:hypothetical protein n=1 Tax=Granulicella sp. dw_53 TaxID=2719792 RepID=UPI001BD32EC9|nr:hypothetical protein [Granulicella sp. dw_53]
MAAAPSRDAVRRMDGRRKDSSEKTSGYIRAGALWIKGIERILLERFDQWKKDEAGVRRTTDNLIGEIAHLLETAIGKGLTGDAINLGGVADG